MACFKKILIVLLLLFIFFINISPVFATSAAVNNFDIYNFARLRMQNATSMLIQSQFRIYKSTGEIDTNFYSWCRGISLNNAVYGFVAYGDENDFFTDSSGNAVGTNTQRLYFGYVQSNYASKTTGHLTYATSVGNTELYYTNYTSNVVANYSLISVSSGSNTVTRLPNTTRMAIPIGCENAFTEKQFDIIHFVSANNSFPADYDTSSVENEIQETNSILTDVYGEVSATTSFLNDTTTDNFTINDLPQSTITDPTESLWNRIFYDLYNALADTSSHSVTLSFPFGDNPVNIVLSSNSLDFVRQNTVLMSFFTAFWSFAIYYFIIKDIYQQLNDLSQGHIDDKVDNVKTTLL